MCVDSGERFRRMPLAAIMTDECADIEAEWPTVLDEPLF
jgi:hypothetical protein